MFVYLFKELYSPLPDQSAVDIHGLAKSIGTEHLAYAIHLHTEIT